MRRPCASVDVTIAAPAPAASASVMTSAKRATMDFTTARLIEAQVPKKPRPRM
jgi:hypothetical protein